MTDFPTILSPEVVAQAAAAIAELVGQCMDALQHSVGRVECLLCEYSRLPVCSDRPCGTCPVHTAPPIRERRVGLGLSLEEFARELGITAETVALWEAGRLCPSENLRRRAAHILNCSIEEVSNAKI